MALSAPTYAGPIDNTINNTPAGDALINSNQIQASKLGVSLPGVGTPAPKPATPTPTSSTDPNKPPAPIEGGWTFDGTTQKWVANDSSKAPTPTSTSPSTTVTTDSSQTDPRVQAANDLTTEQKKVDDAINNIQTGATPLNAGEQAQIDGLKSQYQQLITDQQDQNSQLTDAQNILDAREGRTQYMPMAHLQTISKITTAGTTAVANLMVKEASAVAAMTQGFHDNDIKAIRDAWTDYQTASTARKDALQKTIDDTQKAIKDAADAKIAADKVTYDTVTKPIQDIQKTAKDMGAPASVMSAIGKAKTLDEAYAAAGDYAAGGTGTIAEYNYAKANGYTGSISDYQQQQENMKATAKARADAAVSGIDTGLQTLPAGMGGDKSGGSILAATGLSYNGFLTLTGHMSQLPRDAATRNHAAAEVANWANKNGVDVSTFTSQYEGYNTVLQKNIQRANQTAIMAGEVTGTADTLINLIKGDQLSPVQAGTQKLLSGVGGYGGNTIGSGMGSVRASNILDLMAGKQVNNPFTQKYGTQIQLMANDLSGYLAAARGAPSPELQDQRDAANIISNGMNGGSVAAFRDSITANEQKVQGVVDKAVDTSRQQVWSLFGVGDKYQKGGNSTADTVAQTNDAAKQKIDAYIQQNPAQLDSVTKLYNTGTFSDEQVAEYLHL